MRVRYRKSEGVISRQIAGETLLVPIRGELAAMQQLFALDQTGEFIWALLDRRIDIEGIRNAVVEVFDVTIEEAGSDIEEFVGELASAGLIEEVG